MVTAETPGRFRIVAAYLYDLLPLIAIWFLAAALILPFTGGEAPEPGTLWFQGYLLIWTYGYFVYNWSKAGQTLGMRAWRLHLCHQDGQGLSLQTASLRFIGSLFSLACFGLGHLWRMGHPERHSWHDLMFKTAVVHNPQQPLNKNLS